ncbi:MAG: hypothetical protein HRT72_05920 [Flavobacteriales bacterium]|nr:hypothetical protein [Flavobacteriales bacterium]
MDPVHDQLFQKQLLTPGQHHRLDDVHQNRIVSIYYELRFFLYVGALMFASGIGYFAYTNIGEMMHIIAITLIALITGISSYYVKIKATTFSWLEIEVNDPYFSYILLLGALLFASLLTYLQVYLEVGNQFGSFSSMLASVVFFYLAYRYDSRSVLSLAIAAFIASVGLSINFVDWVKGDWEQSPFMYDIGMGMGLVLYVAGYLSKEKRMKEHFAFTYMNYGALLIFVSGLSNTFDSDYGVFDALITLVTAAYIGYRSWVEKEYTFFLYASVVGYILFTFLFFKLTGDGAWVLWIYYLPISSFAIVWLLIKKRHHFVDV